MKLLEKISLLWRLRKALNRIEAKQARIDREIEYLNTRMAALEEFNAYEAARVAVEIERDFKN